MDGWTHSSKQIHDLVHGLIPSESRDTHPGVYQPNKLSTLLKSINGRLGLLRHVTRPREVREQTRRTQQKTPSCLRVGLQDVTQHAHEAACGAMLQVATVHQKPCCVRLRNRLDQLASLRPLEEAWFIAVLNILESFLESREGLAVTLYCIIHLRLGTGALSPQAADGRPS